MFNVSIIGRPNVGKSTLFNALVGERVSIVEPTPGVTRDRVLRSIRHEDKKWNLIDTGGIGIVDNQDLSEEIEFQLEVGLSQADLVLFVVDARSGLIPDDHNIANELRKANKQVLLLVNKTDDESKENDVYEFSSLGLGDPLPISAKAYRGIRELKKTIADIVPEIAESLVDPTLLKIAVAGRRNVGKSSFINYIAGEERVIVSSHAGTTRDSIDVEINNGSKHFVLIDTAGMRKKTKFESAIEFFSACRTEIAIKRADIVLLFLDAVEGISNVDAKLAQIIQEEGKLCIVVTTKMDLAKEIERVKYKRYIDDHLPGLSFAPLIFISSKTGENIWKLIDLAFDINTQGAIKIATSDINEILYEAQRKHPHEVVHGVRPKFFYGTQIKESPPRILIFVRHKKHIKKNYTRFLGNEFRRQLKTPETPYSFVYRENQRNTHNNINEDDNDEGVLETTPEFLDYYDEENDEGHSV